MTTSAVRGLEPELYQHELATAFAGLVAEPLDEEPPRGSIQGTVLGNVGTYTVAGTPQVVRRTRNAVRDHPADPLKMCLQLSGRAVVHQGDREVVIEPGTLAIYDTGVPYDLRLEGAWSCAVLAVPRDALDVPSKVLRTTMRHAVSTTTGAGAVLAGFVSSAAAAAPAMQPSAAARVAEASLQLLTGTLNDGYPRDESPADARRVAVIEYIRQHLHDRHLAPQTVADANAISPRTLQRLFAEQEHSVTEYIREQRLLGARRDLTEPAFANQTIAGIAARWCFVDQAHFTRAFKTRFGTTPGHARSTPAAAGTDRTSQP